MNPTISNLTSGGVASEPRHSTAIDAPAEGPLAKGSRSSADAPPLVRNVA
jgi:hypothetical protein